MNGVGKPKGHLDPDKDILLAYERRPAKIPEDIHYQLHDTPDVYRWVRRIAKLIMVNRHENGRVNIVEFVEQFHPDPRTAHDLCRAAHYTVRRRLSYWGIDNPEEQWYCSYCKEVRPLEEFAHGHKSAICVPCQEKKRRQSRPNRKDKGRRLSYAERTKQTDG